jgi:hypothetical protein
MLLALQESSEALIYGTHGWKAKDQRGRLVRVYHFSQNLFQPPDPSRSMSPEQIRSLHRELRPRWLPRLFLAIVLIYAGLQMTMLIRRQLSSITISFLPVACFVYMGLMLHLRSLGANPEAIALALRKRRRCASCAYDLSTIPPDPDTCTTRPECGSAWRIPPTS